MPKETKLTSRDDYIHLAAETRAAALLKSIKAPQKRQYINGVVVDSKRDVMQGLRTNLININRCCVEAGFDHIMVDPDDEPINLPSTVE